MDGQNSDRSKADLKRERKETLQARSSSMRFVGLAILFIIVVLGLIWWGRTASTAEDIIIRTGLHWHAKLDIYINGDLSVIPANVGIPPGVTHPHQMHTHQPDNIIHMEFEGVVRKDQLKLKHFFEIWGKDFSRDTILSNKTGASKTIVMKVNGATSTQFEEYELRDLDKVEIIYK